jgi:hypothetical protein
MPYLILEVHDSHEWPEIFRQDVARADFSQKIPPGRGPTVLHCSRGIAEREALRLAKAHPGKVFALFEPVAAGVSSTVPTHVTIGGQVVQSRTEAHLADIADPDDIPF